MTFNDFSDFVLLTLFIMNTYKQVLWQTVKKDQDEMSVKQHFIGSALNAKIKLIFRNINT